MEPIWVEHLAMSAKTAQKLVDKHKVLPTEVRSAVEQVEGLMFTWDDHPERGRRAILRVMIRKTFWYVVLYPDDMGRPDMWHLGSAYEDT